MQHPSYVSDTALDHFMTTNILVTKEFIISLQNDFHSNQDHVQTSVIIIMYFHDYFLNTIIFIHLPFLLQFYCYSIYLCKLNKLVNTQSPVKCLKVDNWDYKYDDN